MALSKEDLQAIAGLLEPINARLEKLEAGQQATSKQLNSMQSDIDEIKEHTAITRDVVNGVSEWTEIASDVLRIEYPLPKAE